MKLSNKILIGFFGFLFLYLTAAFTEIRFQGTPNVINDSNSKAETIDLSGIHYLVVTDPDRNIHVVGSDRSQLQVRSLKGDLLKKLKYQISGDTLTVAGLDALDNRTTRISVYVPKESLRGIIVKSADVEVRNVEQTHLRFWQDKGRIWVSNSQISSIEMDLTNESLLDISSTDVDTLSANLNHSSEAHFNVLVGVVRGTVSHHSLLRLSGIREIQVKKDESSSLNIY